jgi:hypothetical protein
MTFSVPSSDTMHIVQECGVDFTAKLEGMFSDMDLARSVMGSYKQHCRECASQPSGKRAVTLLHASSSSAC